MSVTRRHILALLASAAATKAQAAFGIFQVSSSAAPLAWQPLRLGAGGWVHDIDIHTDGTMVCQTDTYGAYVWNPNVTAPGPGFGAGVWQQLCDPTRLPATRPDSVAITNLNLTQSWVGAQGCYAIRIAPSNSSILYMIFMGCIYKSTDKGVSFSNTGFTPVSAASATFPPNDSAQFSIGRRMAIDPINPSRVLVGSGNGLYITTDGGTNWSLNATVGSASFGVIVAYDERVSTQSGGNSQVAYAGRYGTGIYKTADAGANWALTNSGAGVMPTTMHKMVVDVNGDLWVTDETSGVNAALHKYSGTTWSVVAGNMSGINSSGRPQSIAINPTIANAQRIVLGDSQNLILQTTDGGTTWDGSNWDGFPGTLVANDIPWLAQIGTPHGMSNGNQVTDSNGVTWLAEGVGVWYGTIPTPLPGSAGPTPPGLTWTSRSAGIEQLVVNNGCSLPNGNFIAASWDRSFITMTNPKVYPSTYQPLGLTFPPGGTGVDYATSNGAFVVAVQSGILNYSSDSGGTWNTRTNLPSIANGAGSIAASTSLNYVYCQASGQPYYTTDGGVNWNALGSYFSSNFGVALNTGATLNNVVTDRVDASTFYLMLGTNLYKSTNGGAAWTLASAMPETFRSYPLIRSVLGKSGHLFFTAGQGVSTHPQASTGLWRSQDHGATWQNANSNVQEPWVVGIGKQEAGGTYPSVFFWGWYSGVPGVWKSTDNCVSFTKIGEQTMYGTLDLNVNWLEGDLSRDGACYVCLSGSGVAYYGP